MDCVTETILREIANRQTSVKDKVILRKVGKIFRELNMFEYHEGILITELQEIQQHHAEKEKRCTIETEEKRRTET